MTPLSDALTAAQRSALLKRGNHDPLAEADLRAMTIDKASELIVQLKEGNYDPSAWDVPF